MNNILYLSDSYKHSHFSCYPASLTAMYSYFESRGGKFPSTTFFGLQYLIKKYLVGKTFSEADLSHARFFYRAHFGSDVFNYEGWKYILDKYDGRLPVSIKAVPEGTDVPVSNILMSVESTDPNCAWLVNYLETLLVQVWYPTTVATLSKNCKKVINSFLEKNGSPDQIVFKLHDFGFRGVSSVESAGLGAAAHLINFMGTDTIAGLNLIQSFYSDISKYQGLDGITDWERFYKENMAGYSIPASEHSTMTSWGRNDEVHAFENILDKYPKGLIACVSDQYDIFNACKNLWGGVLKDKVLARDGTLVIRPDSGDPVDTVMKVLKILFEQFGSITNNKGYLELPPQVRLIQGDGVDIETIAQILETMDSAHYSSNNIAFGSGGALLQKVNRDTQKFAFKCSNVVVNGENREVYKEPITDSGKTSKRGKLKLIKTDEGYHTIPENSTGQDLLQEVFRNGELKIEQSFKEIRERAIL